MSKVKTYHEIMSDIRKADPEMKYRDRQKLASKTHKALLIEAEKTAEAPATPAAPTKPTGEGKASDKNQANPHAKTGKKKVKITPEFCDQIESAVRAHGKSSRSDLHHVVTKFIPTGQFEIKDDGKEGVHKLLFVVVGKHRIPTNKKSYFKVFEV